MHSTSRTDRPGIFERGQRAAEGPVEQRIGSLDPVRQAIPRNDSRHRPTPGIYRVRRSSPPGPGLRQRRATLRPTRRRKRSRGTLPRPRRAGHDDGGSPHSGNRAMFAGGDQVGFTLLVDPVVARVERLERHFVHILESRPLPERFADHQGAPSLSVRCGYCTRRPRPGWIRPYRPSTA